MLRDEVHICTLANTVLAVRAVPTVFYVVTLKLLDSWIKDFSQKETFFDIENHQVDKVHTYKNVITMLAVQAVPTVCCHFEAFGQLDGGLQPERNLFDIENHQENVHCYVMEFIP